MMTHHDLTFRYELLSQFWKCVLAGDSCVIVGVSSMGKTRLLDYIFRTDIHQHFLSEAKHKLILVRVDCNRVAELTEWGLQELLLTALIEATSELSQTIIWHEQLETFRRDAILSKNALLVQRYVEMAIRHLCKEHSLRFTFILDEFDAFYLHMPAPTLANLRALRDLAKPYDYGVSYVMMLRDTPARLRDIAECEGFYELFSRNIFGLQPYSHEDAQFIIDHFASKRKLAISKEDRATLIKKSGGHAGILVALINNNAIQVDANIYEECRKIWAGLADDERQFLSQYIGQADIDKKSLAFASLSLKGIIKDRCVFSPLFEEFVLQLVEATPKTLSLDENKLLVYVGKNPSQPLSAKEFSLMKLLYAHANELVQRDVVMSTVYPNEHIRDSESDENRLDAFIRRLRSKFEPVPSKPIYLLTMPGFGYRLLTKP